MLLAENIFDTFHEHVDDYNHKLYTRYKEISFDSLEPKKLIVLMKK